MPGSAEHRLVLQSRFDEVARAEAAVLELAEQHGYDATAQFAIKLSMEEAITNAIKHGNQMDPAKSVTVTYSVTENLARITVCDQGGGFTPNGVPDPTLDENLEKPHGRGIMLIKAYMTEASYSDCGRCLTMIKQRDCRLPEQA